MAKKILVITLWIALVLEVAMTVAGFATPTSLLGQFRIAADPSAQFLVHVVAWFLLLVDGMIGYAIWKIGKSDPVGWEVASYLGGWWLLLGISIYVFYGRPDNLFLDSLKGLILLVASYHSCPKRNASVSSA